ncbi:methyltransferase [Pseudonocardia sp. NPDC049154]|uniref:class I SAM-dependent methyltransferase n=1 Tax=Pseudonocardia sp. NPDC049154 TaxID=3155501 RepID=UPI0033F7CB25
MSGTDTSAPETVLPAADTALDQPARAFDRIVRNSDAYRAQLRTTIHRMGLSGRKRTLLVVGCGSGAPVQGVVDEAPGWKVVAVDESAELVGTARRLDWAPDYRFLHGTLGTLDDALRAEGIEPRFDGILVVFQMRHQRNLDDTLDYLLELLAPGAPLAVHEYSVRGDRAARVRWTAACWLDYLPRIRMRGRVPGMASYLWHSVLRFDSASMFKERLEVAGFTDVRVQTVGGWQEHILYTFLGRKPEDEPDEPLDDLGTGETGTDSWADRDTDTPPAASAPVPAPRPSPSERPEWGPVSRREEPADDRGDVFDLDEEEDEAGYAARDGAPDPVDTDESIDTDDDGPTSYADMDEFEDNHDLDGTQYLDDPDETVLFTHADPDAETPPAGMPVVDGEGERAGRPEAERASEPEARTEVAPALREEPRPGEAEGPREAPPREEPVEAREGRQGEPAEAAREAEEPRAVEAVEREAPAPPVGANAAARSEKVDAPTLAEDADAGLPAEPADPAGSTGPAGPAGSTEPTEPAESAEPVEPVASGEPTKPTGPTKPTEPTEPAASGELTPPAESAERTKPTEPDASGRPAEPVGPGEPVREQPEPAEKEEAPRAPAATRVRNLFRGSRRSAAPAEPPGSPWLRRSEREATRRDPENAAQGRPEDDAEVGADRRE